MSAATAQYAVVLEAKRSELRATIGRRDEIAIERHADPIDNGWQYSAREVSAAELAKLTAQLRAVEAAIARLKASEYGTCCDCEDPISPRRLAAVPWADRCVRCQEMHEQALEEAGACGGLEEVLEA